MARGKRKTTLAEALSAYRVRFTIDQEAQFEECNGEARPLTEAEYAKNSYRACPDHPRAGSKVLDTSVSPNVVVCPVCAKPADQWTEIPYAEYLAWYGNPEKHVYLQLDVEKGCPCCGSWTRVGGLGHIDFMVDAPELGYLDQWYTEAEVEKLPGYLREVAEEDLREAKHA